MKAVFLRSIAIAMSLSLGACATTGPGDNAPVDVTRFHLGQPVARATIAVEPIEAADRNSLEFSSYRAAVERQLARLGWTVVNTVGQSEQIALIDVEQGAALAEGRRSPVSIGVGAGTGGYGGGIGAGVGFPIGGSRSREAVATMLEVSIRRRSDGTVFWEGRAQTQGRVGTPDADRMWLSEKLAEALFRDFPGESGRTIRIR